MVNRRFASKFREKKLPAAEQRKRFIEASKRLYYLFKPPIKIFAIDPSRNSLGWAFWDGRDLEYGTVVPETGIRTTFKKVVSVTDQLMELIDERNPRFILMEDYAYGENTGREMAGETQGCIKYHLQKRHLPIMQPSPHQIKNFVEAERKPHIMMEVLHKWKVRTKTDDEADAVTQVMIGKAVFDILKYVVSKKLEPTPAFPKQWRDLCKSEGLSDKQGEVIFRLVFKKGRNIWL